MADALRVLIADDEALHNLALTSQLETLGHTVVATATNGKEAVQLARETKPDLAFLDIRMPVMTGPASCPSNVPTVANAASYRPSAMPTPSTVQAAYQAARLGATAIRS